MAQTGKNFSGFGNIDWGQVGVSSIVGGVGGAAGGAAGYAASGMSFLVSNISSPVLRSAVVSPLAAGAGHVAGGTVMNLFAGQKFGEAFSNSFKGIGKNMAIGGALGVVTTIGMSYANKVNPLTGNKINTTSKHAQQRIGERNVSQNDINDALKNPLQITEVKYDAQGLPSVKYIENNVTVVVNPETGNIITYMVRVQN